MRHIKVRHHLLKGTLPLARDPWAWARVWPEFTSFFMFSLLSEQPDVEYLHGNETVLAAFSITDMWKFPAKETNIT
jgi:hypothetical protein